MAEIAGLKLITPTSVAGTGVSLSGAKVVFTAATSVSVNGVFDSTYDNYLIVISYQGDVASPAMRLRVSGTDAVGASDYVLQQVNANGTSVGATRETSDQWLRILHSGPPALRSGGHIYIYGPALAQPTAVRSLVVSDTNDAYLRDGAGTHSLSTQYDGFSIIPSSNNITGALTIYGLSQ